MVGEKTLIPVEAVGSVVTLWRGRARGSRERAALRGRDEGRERDTEV